ncbi:MAG TPA: PAS domain-containing sensor histidine kinase, partial [Rubricoccaceae bacterium]
MPRQARPNGARELTLFLALLALTAGALASVGAGAMLFLEALRKSERAEDAYAHVQDDAVYHLTRYAATGALPDRAQFAEALAALSALDRARAELLRPVPREHVVRAALEGGGLDPADAGGLVLFYRLDRVPGALGGVREGWAGAGRVRADLYRLGAEVHAAVSGPPAVRAGRAAALADELAVLRVRVNALAAVNGRGFSVLAGRVTGAAYAVLAAFSGLVLALSLLTGRLLAGRFERAQSQYREVFEASRDALVVSSLGGEILEANEAAGAMGLVLGGRAEMPFVRPEDREAIVAELRERGGVRDFEAPFLHPDGTVREGQISAAHLPARPGRPPAMLSAVRDVTERKRAEEALRESEEQYRAVVGAVRDVVFQTDGAGRLTFLNPAWRALTGRDVDESLGRPLEEFFHEGDVSAFRDRVRAEVVAGAASLREEARFVRASGEERWGEVHVQVVRDGAGRFVGTAGILTDVTDTRRFEAEREARAAAEETAQLKSAILANMSHEIRTPLTGIIGYADVLADELQGDQRESAEVILRGARRLHDTLNSVLALAQLESGSAHVGREPVDVLACAREVAAVFDGRAGAKGVRLEVAGAAPRALADPGALYQVLVNLVGNAVKFTERGSVRVAVDAEGPHVRVRVADTGVGIGPAFLPRVFHEYEQ